MTMPGLQHDIEDNNDLNESEKSSSNESIIKATERLRKKKLSRTEAETLSLIQELEARRIQLDMHKAFSYENGTISKTDAGKLIAIFDLAPTGYFILDATCNICNINQRGMGMLGHERAVLLKSNFRQYIATESMTAFDNFLQDIIETNTEKTCDIWIKKDGENPILIHLEGVKSFSETNFLLTAVDITGRELAERKLKDSEIRYRTLFESALIGIMILDGITGKILDVNPHLKDMLGFTFEELSGKDLWSTGIITGRRETFDEVTQLLRKGYIHIYNLPVNTRDGRQIYIELAGNHFTAGNERVIQLNFHDITERKIAEEKLTINQARLNELNATKDKFFSIIAHDLKNSFNSIIGIGNILAEKVREKDYESIESFAEIIQDSSWKAMSLLTNLLEWARSQTGSIDFNPRNVGIRELISEVCELIKVSAEEKSIEISIEDLQNATVFCDKEMISTVLRNLVSNSVKFTSRDGKIVISVTQDEKVSTISVWDSGIGMKKETIDKLFRIEESFSNEGTEGEKGTGMGLLLCKDFIDRHGGKIWVESEPGKGTKFVFTLPAKQVSRHNSS